MKRVGLVLVVVFALSFAFLNTAHAAPEAYIDPNTGGLLFQMLAAAFVMMSSFLFFFASKIKGFFARMFGTVEEEVEEEMAVETAVQDGEQIASES